MMNWVTQKALLSEQEPIHLLALKGSIYAAVAALVVWPIAPGAGLAAAIVGVAAGLAAGRALAASPVRSPVVVLSMLLVVGLGLAADRIVGGPTGLAGLVGYRAIMVVGEVLTFGLITLGLVAGNRALAHRLPFWGTVELALVGALVVCTFAGHRDSHLGRPQFLSDWVLSMGYDPVSALLGIGLAGFLAAALLLLRPQHPGRSAASVLALVAVAALLLFLSQRYLSVHPQATADETPAPVHAPQQPRPDPKPEPKPKAKPQPPPDVKPQPQPLPQPQPTPVLDGDVPPQPDPEPEPKPTAIVNFLDEMVGSHDTLYFRRGAESQLDGVQLVKAAGPEFDRDVAREFPSSRREYPVGQVDPKLHGAVPQRISLMRQSGRPFGMVDAMMFEPRDLADARAFGRTYHVTSRVLKVDLVGLGDRKAGDPSWTDSVRAHYLTVPPDPRYGQLAREIIAGAINEARITNPTFRGSPMLRAMALLRWIETHTVYSKHPAPAPDVTAAFLFDGKPGKCTEVAHSMVFLLRSLGIPARAASGYAAPASRMGSGSYLLIQDTDAHQWCEVYLEGVGWVVVDASPEKRITPADSEPDPVTQTYYGEKNREPEEAVVDRMKAERSGRPLASLAPGVVLLVLGLYSAKVWRRLAPRWAAETVLYRVSYRSALDRLAEVGVVRRFGETREEFAQRHSQAVPELVVLTVAHDRGVVMGQVSLDRRSWLDLEAKLAARLAGTYRSRRRLLGLFDPLAWTRVR